MEIRPLATPAELAAVDELAGLIWRTDGSAVVPRELLRVFAITGSYVAGAFDGDRLVAFAVGVLGRHAGELELHSHVAGVHPDLQNSGLGFALKLDQRRWALDQGIRLITWTFDPLVRRNAVFNLAKLGASATEYLVDFYGEMTDGINTGQGSDRWWVRWELDSPEVRAAVGGTRRFVEPAPNDLVCAIPEDVEDLRATDAEAARRWRRTVRQTVTSALADGYAVAGLSRAGAYVLRRS